MVNKNKSARYISAFLLLVVLVTSLFLSLSVYHRRQEGKSFRENYGRLKVGLSKDEVRAIWGVPEYIISGIGGKELWSYGNEGHPIHFVDKITFSDRINRRKEPGTDKDIPLAGLSQFSSYSNAELLFDKEGKLEAYTNIGEEAAIHTKYGDVAGSGWQAYDNFLNEFNRSQDED